MNLDEFNEAENIIKKNCVEEIKNYFLSASPEQQLEMAGDLYALYDEYGTNSETQKDLEEILTKYSEESDKISSEYWRNQKK